MTDYDSLDDNAFRLMVREWIAANYPQRIRNPPVAWGARKPASGTCCCRARAGCVPAGPGSTAAWG